ASACAACADPSSPAPTVPTSRRLPRWRPLPLCGIVGDRQIPSFGGISAHTEGRHAMTTGRLAPALGLLALAAVAPVATADFAHVAAYAPGGTAGVASFSGTLTHTPTGPPSAALGIALANAPPSPAGKLTGFVLRLPSADPAATLSLTSTSH